MGLQTTQRERVFGENGETVEDTGEVDQTEAVEAVEAEEPEGEALAADETAQHKYRIGDKTFQTQAEALTYAESQVQSTSEVDAYRQVLREAISQVPRSENVTPQVNQEENTEELYTNPNEYLRKRDERIKAEVFQQLQQSQASNDADNRIWREFTDRHPDLHDFREEITTLTGKIQPEVVAISRSKGQVAAYDYVATKFKAHAERITQALKPKRTLSNNSSGAPVGTKVEKVTSKVDSKKPLSFSDQIRNMRKRR
jgi:hypothetical protein